MFQFQVFVEFLKQKVNIIWGPQLSPSVHKILETAWCDFGVPIVYLLKTYKYKCRLRNTNSKLRICILRTKSLFADLMALVKLAGLLLPCLKHIAKTWLSTILLAFLSSAVLRFRFGLPATMQNNNNYCHHEN